MNVTGLPWFEKAIQTKGFAVGEYQVSRITDKPVLVFGYPVGKDSGKAISVLFIAVGIDRINQLAAGVQLPKDAAIAIIDRKGTVLARHPHPERWVGLSLPETPLIKTILTKGKGTAEVSGLDGIPRLYAFTALNNVPEGDIYLFQSLKGIQAIAAPTHYDIVALRTPPGLGGAGGVKESVAVERVLHPNENRYNHRHFLCSC